MSKPPEEAMRPFHIHEAFDEDGGLRLALIGDLGAAVVGRLGRYCRHLRPTDDPVRLDLSRLEFIDSAGLSGLVRAVRDRRRAGLRFEVDPPVQHQVDRLIDLFGAQAELWPAGV